MFDIGFCEVLDAHIQIIFVVGQLQTHEENVSLFSWHRSSISNESCPCIASKELDGTEQSWGQFGCSKWKLRIRINFIRIV